jgi:hypothetical protein
MESLAREKSELGEEAKNLLPHLRAFAPKMSNLH